MLESVDNKTSEQSPSGSKAALVTQVKAYVRSGDYARARDLLGAAGGKFANDAELADLETQAQDGVKRKAEADRLITESQDLFAQRKAAEAIQVLRKAYELDKKNSLARAILANALVEHAQSIVETDWLEAETLTNQALALNPAHPTAKTILNQIVEQKQTSSVEDWVSRATKLQSSGDLFAALAWVAEGLAVHPNEPKLLQMQDAIQRDQSAQKRQSRRRDLDDLKRMEREISGAADDTAKQALATRIQTVAAKHWTDGEILSIANALLLRLGLVAQGNAGGASRSKGATLILHVPRPTAAKVPATEISPRAASGDLAGSAASPSAPSAVVQSPTSPNEISHDEVLPNPVPPADAPGSGVAVSTPTAASEVPASRTPSSKVPPSKIPVGKISPKPATREKVRIAPPELKLPREKATAVIKTESLVVATKVAAASSRPQQAERSSSRIVIIGCAAAIILVAATFFFTRKHYAPMEGKSPAASSTVSVPSASQAVAPAPDSAQTLSTPAETTAEPSRESSGAPSDSVADLSADNQPPAPLGPDVGTLVVVAGQDDARVLINGRLQRQLTRGGQLRVPNLEPKDYVIRVSKNGFQDPQPQKVRIRQGEEAKLIFNLQPQPGVSVPALVALSIRGGAPGTTVLIDQSVVGTIQADGTLAVSSVNSGDHTIELRRDRFKPRQIKKHFAAGGTVSLVGSDTTLEPATGELKISFAPADARVALVKGELLKMVSSGVPLNLDAGTYTLTARTADRMTRSGTIEVVAGQTKTLDLPLAPNGMSKWDDPGGWKHEGDSFTRKGGDFVLYGVVPTSGSFVFSAMPTKGRLQWVLNYTDPKNYLLLQIDDNNFYRSVIRNGQKTDEIIVPHKIDKKSLRTVQIRVSSTEIIHQIKEGEIWRVLDRWTQPGTNLSQGKFGFYIPHNDQVALSSFVHYADLNIR